MLCSKLRCQKCFRLKHISYKIVARYLVECRPAYRFLKSGDFSNAELSQQWSFLNSGALSEVEISQEWSFHKSDAF